MTIAMSLKVNDGVVLAADSASTLLSPDNTVFNVYNNANKIVNLVKGLPIGVVTWGAGAIGAASMETLYKDLRRRLAGQDPRYPDWGLNAENYSLDEVAKTTRKFLYEEHYLPAYRDWEVKPQLVVWLLDILQQARWRKDTSCPFERMEIALSQCLSSRLLSQCLSSRLRSAESIATDSQQRCGGCCSGLTLN